MRREKIECSRKGCENMHKESGYNAGHPGWGEIVGIVDPLGEPPHLCPACMAKIKAWLNEPVAPETQEDLHHPPRGGSGVPDKEAGK
jgi:hypothetical protein